MKLVILVSLLIGVAVAVEEGGMSGGYLQWRFDASLANYPFNSPYSPAIARGAGPGDEKVVTLCKGDGVWNISALDIATGKVAWSNELPFSSDADVPYGLTTANHGNAANNTINLILLQHQNSLHAIDGMIGDKAWSWPIPVNDTIVKYTGWNENLYILLTQKQSALVDQYAVPVTTLLNIDSATGQQRWAFNTTKVLPTTAALSIQYAVDNLAAGDGYAFYSKGNKMAAINSTTGAVQWSTVVGVAGIGGQGQAANITDLAYLPREDPLAPLLLTTSNNWSFQRFIMFQLNNTNSSAPPSTMWRSLQPETAMWDLEYTRPVSSVDTNRFYYWSNRTNWNTGGAPQEETYFVGRKLTDGQEVWSKRMNPAGVPASFGGRVYVVTDQGLMAMQGSGGSVDWSISEAPVPVGNVDNVAIPFTYHLTPTFGNYTGQLVASRCLGPYAPSLCMYSGFAPIPSAGVRGGPSIVVFVVAGVAWSVMQWLHLL